MTKTIRSKTASALERGKHSLGHDTSDSYETLYTEIHDLEKTARETFQYQFRNDYQAVIEKLKNEETLSEDDKQLLAKLVIHDAKGYVKHDKDFETWKDQIDRLLSDLNTIQSKSNHTTDDLLQIQSICRSLRSVLPDITFYLRERERIQQYEQTDIQALSPEIKKLLANVIETMMKSKKV